MKIRKAKESEHGEKKEEKGKKRKKSSSSCGKRRSPTTSQIPPSPHSTPLDLHRLLFDLGICGF
jgi:hypothetical protein